MFKVLKIEQENLDQAVAEACSVLKSGELVIFPTETAYGLAANVLNHTAIEKLFAYKGNRTVPVAIAVSDMKMAEEYAILSETAKALYAKYLPGPLTVISRAKDNLDELLKMGTGTIGIRIPDYKLVLELVKKMRSPITATSANISQGVTPYSLEDYLESTPKEKIDLIDLFIDAGKLSGELPSTVVKVLDDKIEIVRQGKIAPSI